MRYTIKNIFNKTNAPYLAVGALATLTLLASGVFAVAPYAQFLAPVAALSVGLPFIIGGAIFSAVVIALSAVAISKNNAISQQEKFESPVAQRKEEEAKARDPVPDVIALPDKDTKVSSPENQQDKDEDIFYDTSSGDEKDTEISSPENEPAKEGVNLNYLDLAVSSSQQEKQANNLDSLDLATSKNLNHLNVEISSPENEPAKEENGQGWGAWGKDKVAATVTAGIGLCGAALYCATQYISTLLNGVTALYADSKLGYPTVLCAIVSVQGSGKIR